MKYSTSHFTAAHKEMIEQMKIDDVTLKTLQLRHFPAAGARTGERANHTEDFMIKTADARFI